VLLSRDVMYFNKLLMSYIVSTVIQLHNDQKAAVLVRHDVVLLYPQYVDKVLK